MIMMMVMILLLLLMMMMIIIIINILNTFIYTSPCVSFSSMIENKTGNISIT